MSQIIVENLVKRFRVAERSPGILGALRGVVHRRYHTVDALDGVSFSIEPGELVGYIGPNGAGKSTTVKIISGILVPDAGKCEILGRVPWRERQEHVRGIGVVFGQRTQLWWDLPVIESFDLLRDIYRVPRDEYARNRDEFIEVMDLGSLLNVPVRQLSLGQRMRCDLAAALLHSPSILFLDEPTIGLDAVSKLAFRDFIRRFNRERGSHGHTHHARHGRHRGTVRQGHGHQQRPDTDGWRAGRPASSNIERTPAGRGACGRE